MPAKITSSHCGREREPRRKTKTKPTKNANSHCRWKLILTNEKQCQEIYTLLTVLVFYRPRITETYRHGETGEEETKLQKILLESTLEVENILQLFFCISLGWTSNRAWQVAFYTKCPSEHTSFPMRNVTVNITSCSSKCHFIHWSLTHHGQAVPLSCNWMLCAWPKEVVLVTASRRRDSSERCIQINGLNKVIFKVYFYKFAF